MQNKVYIGILILLTLILFFFFIPIDNYDRLPRLLPVIAGACIAGTFALFIKLQVFKLKDEWIKITPVVVAVFFGFFQLEVVAA